MWIIEFNNGFSILSLSGRMSQTCSANRPSNSIHNRCGSISFWIAAQHSLYFISTQKFGIISIALVTKWHWIGIAIGRVTDRNAQQSVSHFVFDHKFNLKHLLLEAYCQICLSLHIDKISISTIASSDHSIAIDFNWVKSSFRYQICSSNTTHLSN